MLCGSDGRLPKYQSIKASDGPSHSESLLPVLGTGGSAMPFPRGLGNGLGPSPRLLQHHFGRFQISNIRARIVMILVEDDP